jgi:dTDP-4-dehydrorhamnose reductase
MIGRAIQRAARNPDALDLLPASHREGQGCIRIDDESLTTAEAWVHVLKAHRVDAVVNCVGIWSGTVDEFERVHCTVPVALFDACSGLGIRIVHLSALGFAPDSPLTKNLAVLATLLFLVMQESDRGRSCIWR